MLIDVVDVKVMKGYVLFLRFENGVEGELDISQLIPFKGVFAKLKNLEYFSTVSVQLFPPDKLKEKKSVFLTFRSFWGTAIPQK